MTSTMMAPISALAMEPRPPPSELPPTTAAVMARISWLRPVPGPAPDRRQAMRKPASPQHRPETT